MKVALVVPGGVDRSGEYRVIPRLLWLIERLAIRHEVHVFSLLQEDRTTHYKLLGAQIHAVGSPGRRLRLAAAILGQHCRKRFDLLHSYWAIPTGAIATLVGRTLGIPRVLDLSGGDLVSLPGIDYGSLRRRRGRLWLRTAVVGASRITTASAVMQKMAEGLGIRAEQLTLGVALDRWPVRPPRRRDPSSLARLIHVASLNRVKDQSTLIRAVGALQDLGCHFHLDVVGEDTLGGEIQALCGEIGVSSRVTFHDFLPQAGVRGLMERAHILVMTSHHESGPIVLLEAAVTGVPTVSTEVGHASDWAPEAATTVSVGDHVALADRIAFLMNTEDERLRLASAAQARAISEDADWTARRVLEIYDQVVRSYREQNLHA